MKKFISLFYFFPFLFLIISPSFLFPFLPLLFNLFSSTFSSPGEEKENKRGKGREKKESGIEGRKSSERERRYGTGFLSLLFSFYGEGGEKKSAAKKQRWGIRERECIR